MVRFNWRGARRSLYRAPDSTYSVRMKFLHTGDLHLGKTLHETSLIEDQRHMLDQLARELASGEYAALLIAGDVYDRTVPPAEAVELFGGFLERVRNASPETRICVIPGNHDSAQRLSFAGEILEKQHITIQCDPAKAFTPLLISRGGEQAALFLLPFLQAGSLTPQASSSGGLPGELDFTQDQAAVLVSQADLAREASRRFTKILMEDAYRTIPAILAAHLFTIGGNESRSERVFLGNAEKVSPALFSRFSYVALGHLHGFQKITDRMYYPGAPLAYAFDESGSDKCFLSVEIDCKAPGFPLTLTRIPVMPLRSVRRLRGNFDEFYAGTSFDSHTAEYLEITLTDGELVANPVNLLRPKFPFLLSLRQGEHIKAAQSAPSRTETNGMRRDALADFCRFEEILHGSVDEPRKQLFSSLLSECTDEA